MLIAKLLVLTVILCILVMILKITAYVLLILPLALLSFWLGRRFGSTIDNGD